MDRHSEKKTKENVDLKREKDKTKMDRRSVISNRSSSKGRITRIFTTLDFNEYHIWSCIK